MTEDVKPSSSAQSYFAQGHSCAPSVLMAFAGQFGLPVDLAARLASAYGSGLSSTGQNCGAVSGALMVIGLHAGSADPNDKETRQRMYALARRFMDEFAARHGSIKCPDLLDGCQIGTPEGVQRAREQGFFGSRCPVFIRDAADIVEQIIKE